MSEEWDEVKKYLPEGWEAKAKELGALIRRRRIKTADDLLTLNLLYASEGGSFQATSSMMKLTAGISLDKNAVYNRIKASWPWLQWMARGVCQKQGLLLPKPDFLGDREAILVDASDEAVFGSKSSDYRLHYAFNLFAFVCRSFEITDTKEGETLLRHKVRESDIFVADRVYGTITGMEHVIEGGGGFVLRLRSKAFNLYDASGKKIELLPLLRHLKELESTDIHCFYKLPDKTLRPLRIVVLRKDTASAEQSERKMLKNASRKQQESVYDDTKELGRYIVLATNLDFTDAQVLELYRARWQIEQLFLRLKSVFGFGNVPSENPDSVKAWFYAKLLLAAMCESFVRSESFSPGEERVLFGFVAKKLME